jgi:hypothetical protein
MSKIPLQTSMSKIPLQTSMSKIPLSSVDVVIWFSPGSRTVTFDYRLDEELFFGGSFSFFKPTLTAIRFPTYQPSCQ